VHFLFPVYKLDYGTININSIIIIILVQVLQDAVISRKLREKTKYFKKHAPLVMKNLEFLPLKDARTRG